MKFIQPTLFVLLLGQVQDVVLAAPTEAVPSSLNTTPVSIEADATVRIASVEIDSFTRCQAAVSWFRSFDR